MSVMSIIEPAGQWQMPVPPGVTLPTGFPAISSIPEQLGLPSLGTYTPWAVRTSGISWEIVAQPPDTNVAVFGITQALVNAAATASFGNPLPFVALLTEALPTPDDVKAALRGTPYSYYETQAVFRQSDSAATPRIYFMHWAELRSPGDPDAGMGSLDNVAKRLNAALTYAIQVDYKTTALRGSPALPFQAALDQQLGSGNIETPPGPLPPPAPPAPPPPEPPPPEAPPEGKKASLVGPVLVGTGVAVVTYLTVRAMRRKG